MQRKINSVAVYCGHNFGNNPDYARDAAKLGELLARNKIRLIFGGGNVGLMGSVATAAIDNGGDVLGVSTHNVIALQEPAHENVTMHIVDKVNERKQKMYDLSDAFIILPGGVGTLNELTDIMTMQQIGETKKHIYFLNTDKFWDILGAFMVHMQQNGFLPADFQYDMTITSSPEELIQKLQQD